MRLRRESSHLVVTGVGRTPIRLHWSLMIGVLLWGRGTAGGVAGAFALILWHELGHAWIARRRGGTPIAIEMHAFGGACRYDHAWATPFDDALIAWGGVAAQTLVLVPAAIAYVLLDVETRFLSDLLEALTLTNCALIVLNLLPFAPLDGAKAWPLVPMFFARRRRKQLVERYVDLERELAELQKGQEGDPGQDMDQRMVH
jgi:stage IV sporulation protein FB